MTATAKALTDYFAGANPDDHRLSHFVMVGAVPNEETVMSSIDNSLMRHALRVFQLWGLPVAQELDSMRDVHAPPHKDLVSVINILPQHGGNDFLKSDKKGDVVILCNIARDVDSAYLLSPDNTEYDKTIPFCRPSFTSSAEHRNIKRWQDQLEKTGAKVVMITNTDGFELQEMNNGNYVQVSLPIGSNDCKNVGMLIRRDYLASVEDYLRIEAYRGGKESPLLDVIVRSEDNPESRFSFQCINSRVMQFNA